MDHRIICVGETIADLYAYPISQVALNADYHLLESFQVRTGGDAHNNAVDLASLGEEVIYVGPIGDDFFAENCLASMKDVGINTDHVIRCPGKEQTKSLILLGKDGGRTFYQLFETSQAFREEDIDLSVLDHADFLEIGGTFHMTQFGGEGARKLLEICRKKGIVTGMDVTMDRTGRWGEIIESNYPYLDYFFPSIEQAVELTHRSSIPDMAAFFLERGVGHVVIKAGDQGSFYMDHQQSVQCGCYKVAVKDTTGAGDAFVAGMIYGIEHKYDIRRCMTFATACSALVIQDIGATAGIRSLSQVQKFIEGHGEPAVSVS